MLATIISGAVVLAIGGIGIAFFGIISYDEIMDMMHHAH